MSWPTSVWRSQLAAYATALGSGGWIGRQFFVLARGEVVRVFFISRRDTLERCSSGAPAHLLKGKRAPDRCTHTTKASSSTQATSTRSALGAVTRRTRACSWQIFLEKQHTDLMNAHVLVWIAVLILQSGLLGRNMYVVRSLLPAGSVWLVMCCSKEMSAANSLSSPSP